MIMMINGQRGRLIFCGFRHCGHDQGCGHDFHHNADEYDKYLDHRVAEVGGTWEWGSSKMQGFSENGEPQHLGYFVANLL